MKKLIIAFSAVLLLVPLTLVLAQENSATTTRPHKPQLLPSSLPKLGPIIKNIASTTRGNLHDAATTTREAVKIRVEAIHNAITEHNENLKEKARERFGEVVQKHVRIIVERLTAAVERLGNIAARLESRIEKLESEGHDMANSLALLAEAEVSIEVAHGAVANVSLVLETALSSTTPREHMGAVREAIKQAKEALKDAKDALVKVLQSTKARVQ